MNKLQVFENQNFGQVRTTIINGEPWFVAADVCAVFGVINGRNVTARLDADEKDVQIVDTLGGKQSATVVNEAGLYRMLFTMEPNNARGIEESDVAKRIEQLRLFKRWITHEVIPAIRKHGMYATPQTVEAMLADPDTMIQTLQALKQERTARMAAERKIETDKPKVLFAETCLTSKDNILVRELAKIINNKGIPTGEHRLFKWLRENKLLMSNNEPYQQYVDREYFVMEQKTYETEFGTRLTHTTKVTPKGQAYIINKITA